MFTSKFNHLIFSTFGVALLALVSACGGGSSPPPALRFDQISLDAVAAVRDNSTGLVWAAEPAVNEQSPGTSPSVQELLTLTDVGKNALAENFPRLVLNQEIQSNESQMALPWLVSFSPNNLGEVRNGEPLSETPFSSLRVLDRTKYMPIRFNRDSVYPYVALQGNLMWHVCTLGTTYDPKNDNCKGEPKAFEFNQAKKEALRLSNEGYGGFTGWRLPTKEELQKMLSLSNTNDSLLAAPFSVKERVTLNDWSAKSNPLEYWTSTEAPVEKPDPTDPVVWVVNFDLGQDPGGVNTTNVSNVKALVRLVRNLR